MGSDRARSTYDARQRYRSVVAQQGRVVIEADLNEAREIAAEELREEALDFVGPRGTPDGGYAVRFEGVPPDTAGTHPRNFRVEPGTMYVGGLRVTRPPQSPFGSTYWGQQETEWVDGPEQPNPQAERELIYLHLREQEVSAVEDETLREVALGGPDTSQRTRLTQHIVRLAVVENTFDCTDALGRARRLWTEQGLAFEPATMRLMPDARLKVEFVPPEPGEDPACEPAAQAGYLGAENQLIRVQVSANRKLLWGYDNGSHLYRVERASEAGKVKLSTSPVDAFHFPREGQVVELLRAAVKLDNGQYTAAPTGLLFKLGANPFEPNERLLTLSNVPLPQAAQDADSKQPLFVRIWEEELAPGSKANPTLLGQTGLRVFRDAGTLLPGDYWMVGVRPSTPGTLYPERYRHDAQPPDGPRQWACPLALLSWGKSGGTVLDCRPPFDNLVELTARVQKLEEEVEILKKRPVGGGCCTVTVTPADTATTPLQALLDRLVAERAAGTHITVCLRPGIYPLHEPLRLDERHGQLTLEGCGGAVLTIEESRPDRFLDGLIVLEGVSRVTLRGLELRLRPIRFFSAEGASLASLSFSEIDGRTTTELLAFLRLLRVGVGLRLVRSSHITIEDCRFDASAFTQESFFSAGIFANDTCTGLEVWNNHFLAADTRSPDEEEWRRMAFGFLHTPSTTFHAVTPPRTPLAQEEIVTGGLAPPRLDEATFRGNQFSNLSAAIFLHADLGTVRLEGNQVRNGYAGFWLMTLHASAYAGVTDARELGTTRTLVEFREMLANSDRVQFLNDTSFRSFYSLGLALLTDPLVLVASTLARGYPLPSRSQSLLQGVNGAVAGRRFIDASVRNLAFLATQAVAWLPQGGNFAFARPNQPTQQELLFGPLHRLLAAIEQHPTALERPPQASCHVSDNDIETGRGNAALATTAALTAWDAEKPPTTELPPTVWSLLLSTNRIRARSHFLPAAHLLNVEQSTVTGNIIHNLAPTLTPPPWSFILVPTHARGAGAAATAITGNVFIGQVSLPQRRDIPNLPWLHLNTARSF